MGRFEFARKFKQLCMSSFQGGTMKSDLVKMFVEAATSEGTEVKCLVIHSVLIFSFLTKPVVRKISLKLTKSSRSVCQSVTSIHF